MKFLPASLLASVVACAVPSVLLPVLFYFTKGGSALELVLFSVIACAVTAAHVVFLGIPFAFLLYRSNAIRWWSAAMGGFLCGAIPLALLAWPYHQLADATESRTGIWHGVERQMFVDGVPTTYRWLEYLEGVATTGLLGALSAAVFFAVLLKLLGPNYPLQRSLPAADAVG